MNFASSGNSPATSGSLLLSVNKPAIAPSSPRDSGTEFRSAMDDVAKARKTARPEPTARPDRSERTGERAPAHHKPVQRADATQSGEAESAAKSKDTAKPEDTAKSRDADKAEQIETAAAAAPVTEEGDDQSLLLAEAGLIPGVDVAENSEAVAEETVDVAESPLAPLAPELTGATATPGTILPPATGGTTSAAEAALTSGLAATGARPAATPATDLSGLQADTSELPEGEANLLAVEGEAAAEDPKQSFSRLLAANPAAEKTAQTEQSLTKLAADPAVATAPASRPTEAQAPQQRSFVVQTGVPVGVGQPRWGQAVGERVLWLAAQNVSAAEIRLDPPELGPMQVRVTIHQDQASVSFSSPHAVVREALDQNATRLREMFSEQGLNLMDMDVSDQSFARQNARDEESEGQAGNSEADLDDEVIAGVTTDIAQIRLVDHYA